MTTQTYQAASRRLLAQARAELAAGDVPQASEKGWGAAAQIVKAVAQQRGWPHDSHRLLFRAAHRLRDEAANPDIVRLFGLAHNLHVNFYDDILDAQAVAQGLDDVEGLVGLLESLV